MKRLLAFTLVLIFSATQAIAKTEKFGTWIELSASKKFLKKFEFSFIPEFRLQDDFTLDEYILEGKLGYKPFDFLSIAGSYRYGINIKKNGNETMQHFVFDVTGKTGYNRFDASLRARITNDDDSEVMQWKAFFLRPRFKLDYNIKNWKTDPYVSYEFYYDLKNNSVLKSRYDVGVNRKIGNNHEIGVYYRFQDFYNDKQSIQILGLNYAFSW